MSTFISRSGRSRSVKIAGLVLVCAALFILAAASPSQAWSWDSTVWVKGTVKCGAVGLNYHPTAVSMTVKDQTATATVDTVVPAGSYKLSEAFTDIPDKSGATGTATITCEAGSGGGILGDTKTSDVRVTVTRPFFGNELDVTLTAV